MRTNRIWTWAFAIVCFASFALGDPQEMPQPKKRVDPAYPTIFKKAGIEADVEIKVLVNEQGNVEKAETVSASNQNFVNAAMEAAIKWEFLPARKDGRPIKAEVTIPFKFRLTDKDHAAHHDALFKLTEQVKQFLKGGSGVDLVSAADPAAYIVIGNKYENLRAVLKDESNKLKMLEGTASNFVSSHLETDETETAAYFVLQSLSKSGQTNKFHTIVLMKNEQSGWRIKAWHTSP
jgi:TonB family protein